MPRIERSITFAQPAEVVQGYLSTPSRMGEWLVGFSLRGAPPNIPAQEGTSFKATLVMAGVGFDVEAVCVEHVPAQRDVLRLAGSIHSTMAWLYERRDTGCHVTVIIDYEVPVSALGHIVDMLLIERLNARNLEQSLENALIILEAEPHSS